KEPRPFGTVPSADVTCYFFDLDQLVVEEQVALGVGRVALDARSPCRPFSFRHVGRQRRALTSRPEDVMEVQPGVAVKRKERVRSSHRTPLRDCDRAGEENGKWARHDVHQYTGTLDTRALAGLTLLMAGVRVGSDFSASPSYR